MNSQDRTRRSFTPIVRVLVGFALVLFLFRVAIGEQSQSPHSPTNASPSKTPDSKYKFTFDPKKTYRMETVAYKRYEFPTGTVFQVVFDRFKSARRLESGSYEIEFDTVEYDRDTKEIRMARLRLRTDEKGDKFMERVGTNKDRPIFVQMESVEVSGRTEPCLRLLGTKKTVVMGGPVKYSW